MSVTIADVAQAAGVSTATVDRVLNARASVRDRTRTRVLSAAERLGYIDAAAREAAHPVRLAFVLPGGPNTFMGILAGQLVETAASRGDGVAIEVLRVDGFSPDVLARTLRGLLGRVDGVGIIALDHPIVRDAINEVVTAGLPILTMVSDITGVPRLGYVGIDDRAAGRLAGHLLGRFIDPRRPEIALFAGSLAYRGHAEREIGCRQILGEDFPQLRIVALREVRDDAERSHAEASAALAAHPQLGGIYNIGAGNRGVARALEEAGRAREVVFIGHELTEHTRRFLLSGTMDAAIDQHPRVEARDAIDRLARHARGETGAATAPIRIHAIFRENLPPP